MPKQIRTKITCENLAPLMFDKTLDYMHHNPVVAGFVTKPEDWKYSSARDFCGGKGLICLDYG